LKKNAVPSCNLPVSSAKKINVKANEERCKRRMRRSQKSEELQNHVKKGEQISENETQKNVNEEENNSVIQSASEMLIDETACTHALTTKDASVQVNSDLKSMEKDTCSTPSVKDVEVQVNSDYLNLNCLQNIKKNSELSTLTGLESFDILNTIVDTIKLVYKDKFEKNNVRMNTRDRVIMTYMKLKQNVSYSLLAIIFNCYSAKHCQRVFYNTVKILSKCLKPAIPWPSREEILKNLPQCFEGFEDVRVILDCTEIFIQKPANLCCQIITYSHYKGSQTCKIMTGVSPAGNITYISKPYGGRVTDSTIFQQSDLIKLLEPNDAVMVDRGFLIDEVCEINRLKYIRPPFLKDKKQLSKAESILTSKIVTARVHIERSNQRIKTFKILGSTMPVKLVPILEDIFTVVCATINMSSPILSDKNFMKT